MTPAPCAGSTEIAAARIVRVEKNGALILGDGRAAMLAGIRLPFNDGGPPALADDALHALTALALAGPLTLTAVPPKEDRYDRVRVQAFGNSWLQTELLQRGLARVDVAPDRAECVRELYAAEKTARDAGTGLWAFPAFAIRAPENVKPSDGFVLVEGKVANSTLRDGQVTLDFGRGFSAIIASGDRRLFRGTNPAPENLAGHVLRVRGLVQNLGGRPSIALYTPADIEFIN